MSVRTGKAGGGSDDVRRVVLIYDPAAERLPVPELPGVALRIEALSVLTLPANTAWLGDAEVVIIEVDLTRPQQIEALARAVSVLPLPVVAASRTLTVDGTRRLIRAGAVDVLPLPIHADELRHALDQAGRGTVTRAAPVARAGKIVAFLGAIGGAGSTALATQAGCLFADTRSTCLIDFDIQFGSAALYLNMKPQLNLVDLTDAGERLDAEILHTVAMRHATGLAVVAAPTEMMPLDMLTPAMALHILSVAQQTHDLVLVDLPGAWTDWSLAVLARADQVVVVTSLTVPGIHHARRKLDLMDANNLAVKVVLNRVPHKLFRTIDLADTEKILRRKADFRIANDYPSFSGAVDQGRTLAQMKRGTRVEKDLRVLVAGLAKTLELAPA